MHTSEKDIIKAQKWLQNCGSKVQVTGKMSIGMKAALCSYQRKHNLQPTGELDKATWKVLKKENSWWTALKRRKTHIK